MKTSLTQDREASTPAACPWQRDHVLWFLMAAAVVLGLVYNAVILVGYAPDEGRHFNYVRLLFEQHRLPFLLPDGSEYFGAHAQQPPLYYLLLLPLYALAHNLPGNAFYHLARLMSLVLCVASLPFVYQIAWRAAGEGADGERKNIARLVTAHVALLPLLGQTGGSINNDSLTPIWVALFVWLLCQKYPRDRSFKAAAILGLCMAAGCWSKLNIVACMAGALLAYYLAQDGVRAFITPRVYLRVATTFGIALLSYAPWIWHSLRVFGQFVPPPLPAPTPTGGSLLQIFNPDFPTYFAWANGGVFSTMWSQIDWIPRALRPFYLGAMTLYIALGFLGLVLGKLSTSKKAKAPTEQPTPSSTEIDSDERVAMERLATERLATRIARWSSAAAFAANWLAIIHGALFLTWGWAHGGRYLVPSLFGLAIVLALGWRQLLGASRLRGLLIACCTAFLALNAIGIYWLLAYLNPTYGPKP